ncbi:unnamed protein product [Acanthoscelides obtectus]|uniref:Transposase Tc1-like domain-containing protein n=1 Tax=Acanthoscelides obtectus TaxID=200917 RepID=A0A9P0JR24_ACAOB|nr:unnamed protein product [Acanthoscelides obtectus]CAK1640231.1 hypothetical protein AOBTE_LOCUS11610 [Acanthoscelides obtectus]
MEFPGNCKKSEHPQGTVRKIISLFKQNVHIDIKIRNGRRSKITERDEPALLAIIKHNCRAVSREIAVKGSHVIGKRVSKNTCLRSMKKMGYSFYKAKEKPLVSFKQRRN